MVMGNKEKLEALKSITANSMVIRAYTRYETNIKDLRTFAHKISKQINKLNKGEIGPHELLDDLITEGIILVPGAGDITIQLSIMAMRVIHLRKFKTIVPETLINRVRDYQEFLMYAIAHHVVNKDQRIDTLQDTTLQKKGVLDYELIEQSLIDKTEESEKGETKKKRRFREAK